MYAASYSPPGLYRKRRLFAPSNGKSTTVAFTALLQVQTEFFLIRASSLCCLIWRHSFPFILSVFLSTIIRLKASDRITLKMPFVRSCVLPYRNCVESEEMDASWIFVSRILIMFIKNNRFTCEWHNTASYQYNMYFLSESNYLRWLLTTSANTIGPTMIQMYSDLP